MIVKITAKESFAWPAFGIDLRAANGESASVVAMLSDDKLIPTLRGLADVGKLVLEELNSQGEVLRAYDPKRGDFGPTDKTKLDRDEEDDEALQELADELAADRRKLEADRAALADDQKSVAKQKADIDAERAKLDADRKAFEASKVVPGDTANGEVAAPAKATGAKRGG